MLYPSKLLCMCGPEVRPGIFKRTSDNLTKAAAMQIIREVTALADDEILEIG